MEPTYPSRACLDAMSLHLQQLQRCTRLGPLAEGLRRYATTGLKAAGHSLVTPCKRSNAECQEALLQGNFSKPRTTAPRPMLAPQPQRRAHVSPSVVAMMP